MSDLKKIEERHRKRADGQCWWCSEEAYPCNELKLARALGVIALSDSWEGKKARHALAEVAGGDDE